MRDKTTAAVMRIMMEATGEIGELEQELRFIESHWAPDENYWIEEDQRREEEELHPLFPRPETGFRA
jgi:hypothetical protein